MITKKLLTLLSFMLMTVSINAQEWTSIDVDRQITHPQPMTGLVLWPDLAADLNSTYGGSISLEFSYCLPCMVVTGCNQDGSIIYDWTWFDNKLADVASRGHQLVARFRYEYPSGDDIKGAVKGATAVPQYIKDRSDYHETYASNPGGDGPTYYADWSNEELKRFTKQFYTDFAKRYANDKRLAFLEVGFGHWSEYHIYGTNINFGVNFPTKAYQKEFFLHLSSVMTSIPWLISIDAADDEYTPFVADGDLMGLEFGLFDDSFMHQKHEIGSGDGYNEECWNAIGEKKRWKTGVCGGEVSYYKSSDQKNFLNPAGMYGHTWEEQSAKYHITFMIANDAPGGTYGTAARFKEATMESGYRIKLTKCEVNGTSTRLTVTNEGIAPLYRDAYFAIGETRCETSLKGLLPGEEKVMEIAANLSNTADLKIVSDFILDTQEIQFQGTTEEPAPTPTPTPTPEPVDDATICYFDGTHPSTSQVVLVTGNSSTSKGSVTYGDKTYGTCIKMENATSLNITPTYSGDVTLIFGGSTSPANQTIKIDDAVVTTDANGRYTFTANAGQTYNLKKGTNPIFLFLILLPEEPTAVEQVSSSAAPAKSSQRYNLSGQPVDANYKGAVIVDGKLQIVQ